MRSIRLRPLPTGLALASFGILTACASTNGRPFQGGNDERLPREVVIVGGQLGAAGPNRSMYEALARLRPDLMAPRAAPATDRVRVMPIVYVDGARAGDVDVLHSIPAARVRKVTLVPSAIAMRRFGAGHDAGAVLLTMTTPEAEVSRR